MNNILNMYQLNVICFYYNYSANGEIRNIFPTILEHIDISHNRFSGGKHGGKKYTSSVKKKVLSRRIIQKEVLSKSSQVKI